MCRPPCALVPPHLSHAHPPSSKPGNPGIPQSCSTLSEEVVGGGGIRATDTADAQTAHHATFSTAPTHQLLGSANAETTPARAPAAAANRKQQRDATCEGKNG